MNALHELRQSSAELLACAVIDIFPGAYLVQADITEFGFYYDVMAEQPIDQQALPLLEEKIRELIKTFPEGQNLEMMRENAAVFLEHKNQPIRAKKVLRSRQNIVTLFQLGSFCDYCPSIHTLKISNLKSFKLIKVESLQYYDQDEGEINVFRIHGTVFSDLVNLKKFLKTVKPSAKRDHRLFAKEMDLFSVHEEANPNMWFWHSNGENIRSLLIENWREEHRRQHFQLITTPPFVKLSLIKKSGYDDLPSINYSPTPFEINEVEYVIPPSITPSHALLFRSNLFSYRQLPIRYAECAYVTPFKNKGDLWGILNSSRIYVDTANIFCMWEQLEKELISSLQFIDKITKIFGFGCRWYLRGRGTKFVGIASHWDKSYAIFLSAFGRCGITSLENTENPSFLGPAAETVIVDAIGREWEGPSVSIDFNIPERFGLRYQGSDDQMHIPLLITRSIFGYLERFVALLVEHFEGRFPLWLSPEQVRVITVRKENTVYAKSIFDQIERSGYRVKIDEGNEQLGSKIHLAEREKVPYILIVGDKEEKEHLITVRSSTLGVVKKNIRLEDFLKELHQENSLELAPKNTRIAN